MDLTKTIDFVPAPKEYCRCAPAETRIFSQIKDGGSVQTEDFCDHCGHPVVHRLHNLEEISDLLLLDSQCPFDHWQSGLPVEKPESGLPRCKTDFVADKLIGEHLGEFQIEERIGSGGMARVYLAYDTVLKRHVAIKVIQNRKFVTKESQATLLKSEAISQAKLNHPNVVSIFHVGTHEQLPFLAMEYVDGESLSERIGSSTLSFEEIRIFSGQIAEGLVEAYRNGLVHGDIKPANLLIDDNGTVKLSDFGLARHRQDESYVPKTLIGTPSYMAPELFEKQPIDEMTDLFSLGVTFFQMTFEKFPYPLSGETAEEFKQSLEVSRIEFPETWPESIPLAWKEILQKLLAKKRADRYQSIEELKHDLGKLEKKLIPAKPIPKISSFLVENVVFLFLATPFMTSIVEARNSLGVNLIPDYSWIMGPFAFLTLCCFLFRSPGQLFSQIKIEPTSNRPFVRIQFARYQLAQVLPAIIMVTAFALLPLGTWPVAICFPMASAFALFLICDYITHRSFQSWCEKICGVRTVLDC